MSDSGKRIFTSSGISSSLDTVLGPVIGATFLNSNSSKKSNPNLLSEKSLSSSKSSSGSSLTLTNNKNVNNSVSNNVTSLQFPHHQFYNSQISTSANWNNINIRSNSLCSQKVRHSQIWRLVINIAKCRSSNLILSSPLYSETSQVSTEEVAALLALIARANRKDSDRDEFSLRNIARFNCKDCFALGKEKCSRKVSDMFWMKRSIASARHARVNYEINSRRSEFPDWAFIKWI